MNPASLPAAATVQPSPRSRRWRRIAFVFAPILLIPIGWFAYSLFDTRNAWVEAEAEADRLDPRWRFADIQADRRTVPDAENSALHMIAVWKRGGVWGVTSAPTYFQVFKNALPPTAQLNPQQTALIRGELAKIAKRLHEARRLKDMPHGRFPLEDVNDFMSKNYELRMVARNITNDWLQHDAWLLAQDKEFDMAIESCQASMNAGRATLEEPLLTSHMIRRVVQTVTVSTLERVLAQGEASEERLHAMQTLIEREMNASGWLGAVRGERAGAHHFFENMRDGNVKPDSLRNTGLRFSRAKAPGSTSEWIVQVVPSVALNHYPEYLRFMNQYVEIAKLPIHERLPKLQQWEMQSKPSKNPLIRMTASSFCNVHKSECIYDAQLRCAFVALACERYRLKHENWPITLDALVKEKLLMAIPTDPIDNQPLRYRRTADGIVIYSIGIDQTDNQGPFDPTDENVNVFGPGIDIGIRLWDVPRRRQPPKGTRNEPR